jgi:hypothetical protein
MSEVLTHTMPLRRRIVFGEVTYTALTIREPTVADQLDVWVPGMSQAEAEVALLAHLTSVPVGAIHKMAMSDYGAAQRVMANFPYPPETSESPSSDSPVPPAGA